MSSFPNPLIDNELTYDFSSLDGIDMNDLWEQMAQRGASYRAVWDEESGQFYMSTVAPHSQMDLALSGQTIDDITTVDYSEPVYFVGAGSHELGEVSRQWDVQDSGTVNMSEGWMTESELREAWNADEGMGYFKKANPDMDFDAYFNMVKDGTSRYQAAGGLMAGEQENFLAQLAADHGVQTTWQNSDGDVFNFTGGGYAKSFKVDDHLNPGDYMKMAMVAAVGWAAGPAITSALTSSLGAAGAKAASSAIINLAKSYVTTGELSIEDALLSAALSYGGSELSDALQGSGVIGDIGSKITDFGNDLASNGGDILTSALTAGGMSLVTQMVNDGEIDWKDAAIAAAMAGGTTALKGFLADINKPDAESDILQEISVDAQRKGTQVGDGLWQLDDGTVISDTGNVLGNMSNLDLDGDGFLNGNDLQEIDVNHDFVDPTYEAGDSFYDKYPVPDSTTNPDAFTDEWKDERYSGLSRDQIVDQMKADGFDDTDIDSYMAHWDATNDLNLQELNTATYGAIDVNLEDPYTIGQTDGGQYYIARVTENGEVGFTTISEEQYNELYGKVYGGPDSGSGALGNGDWSGVEDYLGEQGIGSTGNSITGVDPFSGMGEYEEGSGWITLQEGDNTTNAVPIDITNDPVDPETTQDTTDSSNPDGGSESGEAGDGESGDPATPSNPIPPPVNTPDNTPDTLPGVTPNIPSTGGDTPANTGGGGGSNTPDNTNTPPAPNPTPDGTGGTGGGTSTGGGDGTDSGKDTPGVGTGSDTEGDGNGKGDGEGDGEGDGKGSGDGLGGDGGDGEGGMFEPYKPTNTPMPVFNPWSKYRPSARPQLYRGLWSQLGLQDFKL